jgi:hypothetical protein
LSRLFLVQNTPTKSTWWTILYINAPSVTSRLLFLFSAI